MALCVFVLIKKDAPQVAPVRRKRNSLKLSRGQQSPESEVAPLALA